MTNNNPHNCPHILIINTHPLTALPGSSSIYHTINQRLKQPLAILYIDIDHFKAFNDYYGFFRGDGVLLHTAHLAAQAIKDCGNSEDFLGHIGGDDFVIITTPTKAEHIANTLCQNFDKTSTQFYDHTDAQQGYINVPDRRGAMHTYPLITLSIGIVSNEKRILTGIALISQIAAELKSYAKMKPNGEKRSNFVKDRRNK